MRLQLQPNKWSCLLTSFAMVLDVDQQELLNDIGHDGSTIIWPDLTDPFGRQSFHIQEMIDCCWGRGYSVTKIERCPDAMNTITHYAMSRECEDILNQAIDSQGITLPKLKRLKEIFFGDTFELGFDPQRFDTHLNSCLGVLIIESNMKRHAVAWDGHQIFDPSGMMTDESKYSIEEFYKVREFK